MADLNELSDEACLQLRQLCADAEYDDDLVMTMASIAPSVIGTEVLPIVRHVLRKRADAAGDLARLFAYEDVLTLDEAQRVFGDDLFSALTMAGILQHNGDEVRSPYHLRPFGGLWVLADDPLSGRDAVMPPAGTTRQILNLIPDRMDGSVLDMGCGPGSLALAAAFRGAQRVVGTDINPRAIELARFNARLNNLPHVEFRTADLAGAGQGEVFDWVLAQPPYVIQPPGSEAVTYLHGGPTGEELTMRFIEAIPGVLAAGGRALILMEAIVRPDEPLHARLVPHLGDAPLDVIVLSAPGPPPAVQVIAYASLEAATGGGPVYDAAALRYLEQIERIGTPHFHHAVVVLRADPPDTPRRRVRATLPTAGVSNGTAASLEALLAAIDLAAEDDPTLSRAAVSTSPYAHWIEQRPQPDTDLDPVRYVRFAGGFASEVRLSEESYAVYRMLNASPTVGEAVESFASSTGEPGENGSDPRRNALFIVREGLMRGILEPRQTLEATVP